MIAPTPHETFEHNVSPTYHRPGYPLGPPLSPWSSSHSSNTPFLPLQESPPLPTSSHILAHTPLPASDGCPIDMMSSEPGPGFQEQPPGYRSGIQYGVPHQSTHTQPHPPPVFADPESSYLTSFSAMSLNSRQTAVDPYFSGPSTHSYQVSSPEYAQPESIQRSRSSGRARGKPW